MSVPWMPPLTNAHNCVVYLRDGGDGRDGGDFPDGTNLEDRAHNWILDEYEYVGDQNNFVLRRKQGATIQCNSPDFVRAVYAILQLQSVRLHMHYPK